MARHRSSSGVSHASSDAEAGLSECFISLDTVGWNAACQSLTGQGLLLARLACSRISLDLGCTSTFMCTCVMTFCDGCCGTGDAASVRYTVDDALNKCGTWDAFHWLMLVYCGLSWMCDVSGKKAAG